jgi:oligosaccharyltransferase complex subunit beta
VLRSKGYALSISRPQNRSLRLWNEAKTHYIYDAILLLSPQAASFGPGLTAKALLDFVDANRTLILTASSSAGALVRSLADGIGLELDEKGTVLLDHVQALRSTADGTRTTPSTFSVEPAPCPLHKSVSAAPFWEKDMPQQPLVFANAIGAMPSPKQDLLRPILCAPPTSYSYEAGQVIETDEDAAPFAVGTEAMLVGALHGRYGGRVLFIASSDALEDRFMSDSYGNRAYFTDLMTWALGERGILRVARAEHWKVGTSARRETVKHYRIGDRLHLELCVEEWDGRLSEQTWQPWLKGEDLQLEWVMLDPYVRIRMQRNTESGCYTAEFDTPFKHGLFKFRIEHFRDGYTPLLFAQVVPMHPFWHNEYPRLLPRAYPYYAALFTVMFAFWIVAYALLWGNFRYLRKTRASSTPASAREATFSAGAAKSEPGDRGETHRKQD